VVVTAIAALATMLPALRASRLNPAQALHPE
jgi:ABC-type lipoprotein release transport system permease subunit